MMEHLDTHKLLKDGIGEVVEALDEQPFVIVIKTDTVDEPDVQVTVMTADPCDAVVLAAQIIAVYKRIFRCEPVVELMPFLEVGDDAEPDGIKHVPHIPECRCAICRERHGK